MSTCERQKTNKEFVLCLVLMDSVLLLLCGAAQPQAVKQRNKLELGS